MNDALPHALGDAAILSPTARMALMGLMAVLLVILGVLIAYAVLLRRRAVPPPAPPRGDAEVPAHPVAVAASQREAVMLVEGEPKACPSCHREFESWLQYCPHDSRRLVPAPDMLDATHASGNVCPQCRRAFDPGVRFCPHDGGELLPLAARRGYSDVADPGDGDVSEDDISESGDADADDLDDESDDGALDSPADRVIDTLAGRPIGADLMRLGFGTRGVIGKICPQCRRRYDLAKTFCGEDGSELVALN